MTGPRQQDRDGGGVRQGAPRREGGVPGPPGTTGDGGAPQARNAVPYDELRLSEVVVVGTGVAGLAAALGCSPRSVTVLTKSRLGEGGSSAWAQGGVAAAVGEDDDPELHAADTLAVAGGLGDPDVVRLLTREGPLRIEELITLGADFDRRASQPGSTPSDSSGEPAPPASPGAGSGGETLRHLALGREAAHSRRRILHAGGDATGAELVRALVESVRRAPGITVEEDSFALDLVVEGGTPAGGGRAVGVLALDPEGRRVLHLAGAVVLATGGLGQLFRYTTNPREVTGDGLAMAARAGARLVDVEMVQFHPTALAAGEAEGALPLLTEALRGEGAVLVDGDGRRFMPDEHPDAELAPRDVVARAIHRRREAGVEVYLDARAAVGDRFPERFPTVFAKAMAAGLDPRREPLPVTPAAHYHMGGVEADERGRSTLPGLWVCGEVACTGAHGANRLASNSLLEALVFGSRVADDLALRLAGLPGTAAASLARLRAAGLPLVPVAQRRREEDPHRRSVPGGRTEGPDPAADLRTAVGDLRERLRRTLWSRVGLLRDAAGLVAALDGLEDLERRWTALSVAAEESTAPARDLAPLRRELAEVRNLLTAARLVATAALARPESRGAHQREDHPAEDPAWRRRLHLLWRQAPWAAASTTPATLLAAASPFIQVLAGPLLGDAREMPPAAPAAAPPRQALPSRRRASSSGAPLPPPSVAARAGGPERL